MESSQASGCVLAQDDVVAKAPQLLSSSAPQLVRDGAAKDAKADDAHGPLVICYVKV